MHILSLKATLRANIHFTNHYLLMMSNRSTSLPLRLLTNLSIRQLIHLHRQRKIASFTLLLLLLSIFLERNYIAVLTALLLFIQETPIIFILDVVLKLQFVEFLKLKVNIECRLHNFEFDYFNDSLALSKC